MWDYEVGQDTAGAWTRDMLIGGLIGFLLVSDEVRKASLLGRISGMRFRQNHYLPQSMY